MPADAQRETVKAEVTHATRLYYSFVLFVLYLSITVGAMDDSYVIRDDVGVRLPLFAVEVGALGFSIIAPILLLCFHLYIMVERLKLARHLVRYVDALDGKLSREQLMMPWLLFPEINSGNGIIDVCADWLSRGAFWIATAAPGLVLLWLQWRFVARHTWWLTSLHAVLVVLHLLIIWLYWSLTRPELRSTQWRKFEGMNERPMAHLFDDHPRLRIGAVVAVSVVLVTSTLLPVTLVVISQHRCIRKKPWALIANVTLRSWESERKLDLHGVGLRCADFTGSNLAGADLRGADLSFALLDEANLIGAALGELRRDGGVKTRMRGASMVKARLMGADLSGADLSGSKLSGANFSGAVLKSATLSRADAPDSIFIGANLSKADLSGANFLRADLSLANLDNAVLFVAHLVEANLYAAGLPSNERSRGDTLGLDLRKAVLEGINHVALEEVDAREAYFDSMPFCPRFKSVDLRFAQFGVFKVDRSFLGRRLERLVALALSDAARDDLGEVSRRFEASDPLSAVEARKVHGIQDCPQFNIVLRGELPACEFVEVSEETCEEVGQFERRHSTDEREEVTTPDAWTAQLVKAVLDKACEEPAAMSMLVDRILDERILPEWPIKDGIAETLRQWLRDDISSCQALSELPECLKCRLENSGTCGAWFTRWADEDCREQNG